MTITIITVVKNNKEDLELTLKSLFSQTYKKFQYIIFDGLSKDGIESVINKYKRKNIKYIRQRDKNYYDGLNQAIKIAKGDYIGILNAGDLYYDKDVLRVVADKLITTKCDLLFANLKYYKLKKIYTRIWKFPILRLTKLSALKIASPTLFIKKTILKSTPYNIKYNISSDTDFNLRISSQNYQFFYLNKFIVSMKQGGLSTQYSLFFKKMLQDFSILKKHFGLFFIAVYAYKIIFKIKSFK